MTVIQFNGVSKTYRGQSVLANVTLSIEAGRTYGVVGPNGAGKSVLLRLMCGLTLPSTGEVIIHPDYLDKHRTYPDRFGVAIDGPAYIPSLSAEAQLLELARIRNRIGLAEVRDVLKEIGLNAPLRKKARAYSQGMKQKLSLAQAFMESPDVLLLDEPFNALDRESMHRVKDLIHARHRAGATIVFTSHHGADIDELTDEVFEIDAGAVLMNRRRG
ncbi:ABC transporter ATP-binding protein [Luethyella okanaganae]|uniref:ABC transporter ATP-binding protein n=1 Tax=Luethyella okanaganae TaxID=69372 RepID=A0ABW1VJ38_9MICO